MQCSSCTQQVQPVVAIDIDGTLGDYHGHLLAFADMYLGLSWSDIIRNNGMAEYDGTENFGNWFEKVYGCDRRTYRDIKLAFRQGAMKRNMPLFERADAFVRLIKRMDAEVWLTTTRPYNRLDSVDPDTREWLARNNIPYDHLLYDENKYEVLAQQVDPERVVAVFDDLPEQYDAAAAAFGKSVPILRRMGWNRGVIRPNVCGITGAYQVVAQRINDWRLEHTEAKSHEFEMPDVYERMRNDPDIKRAVEMMVTPFDNDIPDNTNRLQIAVMAEAFEVFVERNARYNDLWRAQPPSDAAEHMRHKAQRLEMAARTSDQIGAPVPLGELDDAFDMINYACFFIRNVRRANGAPEA